MEKITHTHTHTHKPWGQSNLRELRDWFPCKYLIYRRRRLVFWQMKTIQESLPIHSQTSQLSAQTLARPLLFALKVKSESKSRSIVSDSLRPHGPYSPWYSPGQNTGVGSLFLFRGSSQPSDQSQVSYIAGREAHPLPLNTAHPKLSTDLPAACYTASVPWSAIPLLFQNECNFWSFELAFYVG